MIPGYKIDREQVERDRDLYRADLDRDYTQRPVAVKRDDLSANLVGSTVTMKNGDEQHMPLFDIDNRGIYLLPSRTPGNSHLFINMPMVWEEYVILLRKFAQLGICDPNWALACIDQGAGFLRRPGQTYP